MHGEPETRFFGVSFVKPGILLRNFVSNVKEMCNLAFKGKMCAYLPNCIVTFFKVRY